MLLNYWLAMRKGAEVSPLGVFSEFRSYVGDQEVNAVMSEVKLDLMNYREFETTRGRSPAEKSFYYHVDVTQAGVITPVLLLLLSAEEGTRIRAFTAIESFLVRRMICRRTTKDYNRLVLELANRLRESGLDRADEVTAGFLREQTADARGMAHRPGLELFLPWGAKGPPPIQIRYCLSSSQAPETRPALDATPPSLEGYHREQRWRRGRLPGPPYAVASRVLPRAHVILRS